MNKAHLKKLLAEKIHYEKKENLQAAQKLSAKKSSKIEEKLAQLGCDIDHTAKLLGFTKRAYRKITAKTLLISFFMTVITKEGSYLSWAIQLSGLIGKTVSKQAIWKRIDSSLSRVLQSVLHSGITRLLCDWSPLDCLKTALFESFPNVWLQDSTCLKLADSLSQWFPGNYSKGKIKAIAKIQAVLELKSHRFGKIELTSFSANDQSASGDVFTYARKGDLVIRDLGYSVLGVFEQCIEKGIYFLSKLSAGVYIYHHEQGQQLNLYKLVKGKQCVDIQVLAGKKQQVPVRLVAIKLPDKVAAERRRKAKRNRDKRMNPSKESLAMMGWVMFISNVPPKVWSASELAGAYRFRWRIENIFKCWKSAFNMQQFLCGHQSKTRVESIIYALLIFAVLFHLMLYDYWLLAIYKAKGFCISLMKFTKFLTEKLVYFVHNQNEQLWLEQIAYFCKYDKRNDRSNYLSMLYVLS